ncbi:outer membrane lipoprotein LolB [Candidatus Nitrosoglobus terrae]|uniref:Outer-membrane lipoprotein LolB n=1 Tax=Candidatus Nitrosoglobus terrae TaxID=1630141 RepID=A0A1Q2SPZ6_9GAMM|nr:lipoprotein insertase outer membrane protein LolB [Candidatus Nitrosoglobus terrae]BAW81177.1 outer membrane lipoprotein LolB [Candidatus Nitrosoglobus terrae]
MKRYRKPLSIIIVTFITILVAGCIQFGRPSPKPPSDPKLAWQERQLALQRIKNWELKGRLAVNVAQDSWTGSVHWEQKEDKFDIFWFFPFGQGTIELKGAPELVTMRLPREEPVTATSAEELLEIRLGWSLPVTGLRYWLLGLPTPELPITEQVLDPWGRLQRLSQGGWVIRYLNYKLIHDNYLPGKVFLDNPKVRMRLVIDRWKSN